MENEGGGGSSLRRAEIDTREPFRSVKEAVMLFGESVLAGEIYANKLNLMQTSGNKDEHQIMRLSSVVSELEEAKQTLEKAKKESETMANCLTSLKEELENTKTELARFKSTQSDKQIIDSDTEEIKFVENTTKVDIKIETPVTMDQGTESEKKRLVQFANPPSLTQVINPEEQVLERQFSVDRENTTHSKAKKKKKKLVALIGAIFSKKKG